MRITYFSVISKLNPYSKVGQDLGVSPEEEQIYQEYKNKPQEWKAGRLAAYMMDVLKYALGQSSLLTVPATGKSYQITSDPEGSGIYVQPMHQEMVEDPGGKSYPLENGSIPWDQIEDDFLQGQTDFTAVVV